LRDLAAKAYNLPVRGDFARSWFDVKRFFSRVLMQQGRVQLDADADETYSRLRRVMLFLEQSLGRAVRWVGFEPWNDPGRRLRRRRRGRR
jgi:uncharacterized protein DUF6519